MDRRGIFYILDLSLRVSYSTALQDCSAQERRPRENVFSSWAAMNSSGAGADGHEYAAEQRVSVPAFTADTGLPIAYDGQYPDEAIDDEPEQVIKALRTREASLASVRISRPLGHAAAGILEALLSGIYPRLFRLELDVDLSHHADYVIGLLQEVFTSVRSLRQVVLLFDPVPIPVGLLQAALFSTVNRLTLGSRSEGIWVIEAATVGQLLQAPRSGILHDRTLVLVGPVQRTFDHQGRAKGSEPWPNAVRRTIKVTAVLNGTGLAFPRDNYSGGVLTTVASKQLTYG